MAPSAGGNLKRVCLTGVESTGKTVLAAWLAAQFGGVVMPEYGREWAEMNGTDFTAAALHAIAAGHQTRRQAIEATRPALIIEDTDIVMTMAWSRMLHGGRDPLLASLPADADLYLLFAPDTEWLDDGTRAFGGSERQRFHTIIVDELAQRGISPMPIEGGWEARKAQAAAAVTMLMRA